jgi:hypothetical protein
MALFEAYLTTLLVVEVARTRVISTPTPTPTLIVAVAASSSTVAASTTTPVSDEG